MENPESLTLYRSQESPPIIPDKGKAEFQASRLTVAGNMEKWRISDGTDLRRRSRRPSGEDGFSVLWHNNSESAENWGKPNDYARNLRFMDNDS